MKRNFRLMGYLVVLAIVLGSLAIGPQAWATSNQTTANQTVPTRTPKPADPPTAVPPTSEPRPTAPQPTDVPPTSAPAPTATQRPAAASPTPAPTATVRPATLSLALAANPIQVWSGVTVVYTLTAVNRSAAALRDVALLVELPAELQPGTITAPKEATWQGTALRVTLAELVAGASAEVVFTAKVAPGVSAGKIIVNRASGSAAGVAALTATAAVALPPAELPSFGGGG
jgi:hypothetical protein